MTKITTLDTPDNEESPEDSVIKVELGNVASINVDVDVVCAPVAKSTKHFSIFLKNNQQQSNEHAQLTKNILAILLRTYLRDLNVDGEKCEVLLFHFFFLETHLCQRSESQEHVALVVWNDFWERVPRRNVLIEIFNRNSNLRRQRFANVQNSLRNR